MVATVLTYWLWAIRLLLILSTPATLFSRGHSSSLLGSSQVGAKPVVQDLFWGRRAPIRCGRSHRKKTFTLQETLTLSQSTFCRVTGSCLLRFLNARSFNVSYVTSMPS